jgi:hypothetical protein
MGGLMSMYDIKQHPSILVVELAFQLICQVYFQLTIIQVPDAFVSYLEHHLPNQKFHEIYFA